MLCPKETPQATYALPKHYRLAVPNETLQTSCALTITLTKHYRRECCARTIYETLQASCARTKHLLQSMRALTKQYRLSVPPRNTGGRRDGRESTETSSLGLCQKRLGAAYRGLIVCSIQITSPLSRRHWRPDFIQRGVHEQCRPVKWRGPCRCVNCLAPTLLLAVVFGGKVSGESLDRTTFLGDQWATNLPSGLSPTSLSLQKAGKRRGNPK